MVLLIVKPQFQSYSNIHILVLDSATKLNNDNNNFSEAQLQGVHKHFQVYLSN